MDRKTQKSMSSGQVKLGDNVIWAEAREQETTGSTTVSVAEAHVMMMITEDREEK